MYREKSGSKILIVLMFIMVAAAVSGAAVYYYTIGKTEVDKKKLAEEVDNVKKENEKLKAENEQLKAAGTETNQSTETKTYTSKKDGYSFEYPASWFVIEDTEGTILTNFKYPAEDGRELTANETKIVINLKNNPQKMTPKTWAANAVGEQTTIIKKEELKVDGKDAYKMKTKEETGNMTSVYVAKTSAKMLEIINYENDSGLTKIIESFKFI